MENSETLIKTDRGYEVAVAGVAVGEVWKSRTSPSVGRNGRRQSASCWNVRTIGWTPNHRYALPPGLYTTRTEAVAALVAEWNDR